MPNTNGRKIIENRITIPVSLHFTSKIVNRMTEESNFFMGIDVSKDTLDIHYNEKHFKIKNESRSISNFIKLEILDSAKIKLCVLESTGGYEKLVMKLLQNSGVKVHRAHPNRVYSFAKTIKHFAKTDKLDVCY